MKQFIKQFETVMLVVELWVFSCVISYPVPLGRRQPKDKQG